jgi:NADH:ubiquinone oxidoreductase subunit 4 (subunit M)
MLLILLLITPLLGIFAVSASHYDTSSVLGLRRIRTIGLTASIVNLLVSLIVFVLFSFSNSHFQFVQEYHKISNFDFYLGVDGISIYFIILTTTIIPIALLSN